MPRERVRERERREGGRGRREEERRRGGRERVHSTVSAILYAYLCG